MASLAMKIKAEMRMRELLEQEGVPMPDQVEYGYGCIRLFWTGAKTVIIVDIDDYGEIGASRVGPAEAEPPGEEDRGPPFDVFPLPDDTRRN
jgi:hypothetical protein